MMDLRGVRDLVASLFNMLNEKTYILFRVEVLVVVVTILLLAMFIMDIFRRYFHSTIMKGIFSVFDATSDSIILFLLGAMQTAPFKNELFPVWAHVLIIFRHSIDFISGYGVPDPGGRRFTELKNVTNLFATASLTLKHGSRFKIPLWSLWALQMQRSWYRFISRELAAKSIWLGWSSELISDYTRTDHGPRKWKPEECNPVTMDGYKYLVYGELCKILKPRYVMSVYGYQKTIKRKTRHTPVQREHNTGSNTITRSSLITLDKIWECNLPGADNIMGKDLKDLSLAFALSRLLRCRLEDVTLQGNIRRINRKLVKGRIVDDRDDKRTFGIMEMQLAFVNDYFNTRYPIVFWAGLDSLFISLLQSTVTLGVICWLSVAIRKVYKPPYGELTHVVQGFNVDVIITWAFMFFVVFKEIWEMVSYLLSDWTRLLVVCFYARRNYKLVRNRCMEFVLRSKINDKRWHGLLDQYVFMQSYDDRPKVWNLIHRVTTGVLPKKEDGAELGSAIDIPEYVWPAVLKKLRVILDQDEEPRSEGHTELPSDAKRSFEETVNTVGGHLPKDITTLPKGSGRKERYGWACFDLQTSSDIILVWHIATSICEMALAKNHRVDSSKPGFIRSMVSCFTGCCSSKPYLIHVDEPRKLSRFTSCCSCKSNEEKKEKLSGELRTNYIIANSLSRYCAYLLVSKPGLIPDSFLVPKMVFRETVKSARDDILKGCDSLESRYTKLEEVAERAAQDSDNIKTGDNVVKQGAMLAKQLLDHEDEEGRWDILSGVWTELLVHMAPTWNAQEHRACLESGGEFITYIWALLWHCGIEKSSLWPSDDAFEDDAPAAPQDNDAGNNKNINPVEETGQAAQGESDNLTGNEIHRADETEVAEEPEAQLKDWTKGSTGRSFEVGESSRGGYKCSDMGGLENPEQVRSRG